MFRHPAWAVGSYQLPELSEQSQQEVFAVVIVNLYLIQNRSWVFLLKVRFLLSIYKYF